MAYLINRLKESLAKKGLHPRTDIARTWLQQKMLTLNPSRGKMMEERSRLRGVKNESYIGKMYFYFYDPKTKDIMEYYDKFPLVIPIEEHTDGFLGLNLHYIHPKQRLILLDKLGDIATNRNFDEATKFRVSYNFLKNAKQMYEHKPCLKKYLYTHIKSKFLNIEASEWDIAALLPVEHFKKAHKTQVFQDSEDKF
jgi:hypothetical protein